MRTVDAGHDVEEIEVFPILAERSRQLAQLERRTFPDILLKALVVFRVAAGEFDHLGVERDLFLVLQHDAEALDVILWNGDEFEALNLRSEEHTSELQSLMRSSYAVFCLKKKKKKESK